MKEEVKQAVEAAISHPKTAVAITAFFTSHVWLEYGLPTIQGLTTILGLGVVITILIKNIIDIKNNSSKK